MSQKYHITIQVHELQGYLDRLVKGQIMIVRRGAKKGARDGIKHFKKAILKTRPHAPDYSHRMLNGFRVYGRRANQIEVVNLAPYSDVMDKGGKPHHVPYGPIARWVAKKMGAPRRFVSEARPIVKKRIKLGQAGIVGYKSWYRIKKGRRGGKRRKSLRRFAGTVYGLMSKLKSQGHHGRHFMARGMPGFADEVMNGIKKELAFNR